jgi:hypothetical protein
VLAERTSASEPVQVARLRKYAPWALRFSVGIDGVGDPFAAYRLYRISLIRELIKASPEKPLVANDGWAANVEFLIAAMPLARRIEKVALDSRYDLRVRPSRIQPLADWLALYRFGRVFRGRRITPPLQAVQSENTTLPRAPKPRERATS